MAEEQTNNKRKGTGNRKKFILLLVYVFFYRIHGGVTWIYIVYHCMIWCNQEYSMSNGRLLGDFKGLGTEKKMYHSEANSVVNIDFFTW